MFELRDLERFLAIVEHTTFGRAAEFLGITQPALSRRIAALEAHVGAPLFSRAHRQIALTAIGRLFAREARVILTQTAHAERVLREAAGGATGQLRVGSISVSRYRLFPPALHLLRSTHPRVSISVVDTTPLQQMDMLRQGAIDVTLVRGPIERGGEWGTRFLRGDPVVAVLPSGHPLAKRAAIDVADLAGEEFAEIETHRSHGYQDVLRGIAASAGVLPGVTHGFDRLDTVILAVAAGVGVALAHDARAELAIPGVAYVPLLGPATFMDLHAVWRAEDSNPVITPFVDHLVEAAESWAPWTTAAPALTAP